MNEPCTADATPRSVYIHVPFCIHRCGYCDFTLVANRDDLAEQYLDALAIELDRVSPKTPIETIFLGGGTPTQLGVDYLRRLAILVRQKFQLVDDCEFSVEANPVGLTEQKLEILVDAGCNRVSLGVQSFDSDVLATLERDHRAADITRSIEIARSLVPNFSIDLIFAVPGQSTASWRETLARAIDLNPTHLSTYGLTFEKGTAFWSRRQKGELQQHSEESERQMYEVAMETLESSGLCQYEISSFARTGFRCRHNQVYWRGDDYWGFGPGAASYVNGHRLLNHRSVTAWLKKTLANESAVVDDEVLDAENRAREAMVLGLRMTDGINRDEFRRRNCIDLDEFFSGTIAKLSGAGWIEPTLDGYRLSWEGRFVADTVAAEILGGEE